MPPEFVPSERRKKKQNPKPKEPRSVDDLVDDIMKDYRDKQRELGNVDNWGQPNEKLDRKKVEKWVRKNLPKLNDNEKEVKKRGGRKFSPSAPTESLSEAIGNKLKEKADTMKDKQKKSKTPKTSEPRKSKPSPRERRSPKPKSPSKNEPRKQLGPKIKTKPSEARKKKIRFPKAPTEGLSKAIGDKLKETAEQLKDRQKTPTISKPRKSTHSPKEKSSLKPKSPAKREQKAPQMKKPSNKESKERLGPKLKMKPLEERRENIDIKNPKENHGSLKDYKVRIFKPVIREVEIKTETDLRKYINSELSGMKYLPYYDKILGDTIAHIRLRESVGNKRDLTLSEIKLLSAQMKLPLRTTRNYLTKEGRPEFYRLAEKAITKSEAKSVIDNMHLNLETIRSYSDVEKELGEKGTIEHLRSLPSYKQDNEMVHKYFKFIDYLNEGGVMRNIARRVGVSEGTCISWTKGGLPSHIKQALETSDSSVAKKIPDVKEEFQKLSIDTRIAARINMTRPEIKGVPVESETHLRKIIVKEYHGMMGMLGFDKMLQEGCVHLRIMNILQGREFLEYGEIPHLAREFNVKEGTLGIWIKDGITPRIHFHLNRSISSYEAKEKLKTIRKRNNGITTKAEYDRRMGNYYLDNQERRASFHKREEVITQKYFKFLEQYQLGGPLKQIAHKVEIAPSTGLGWLEGNQPRRIRIASGIPKEQPKPGQKWLPLKFREGRYPEDSIQVPERVRSYKDVLSVLHQLKPIENKFMKELQVRLSRRSIEGEFMYLLGAYVSDAGIFNETTIGQSLGIRLAKKYSWSYDFGDGFCQSLGACGIYAHRTKNTPSKTTSIKTKEGKRAINQSEKLNWASENSPLVHWIHQSCLGFNNYAPKREQQISADWILTAPRSLRVSFAQGWSDGDGSVSPRGRYFCITTTKNQKFVSDLLNSLGIDTRINGSDVFTSGVENAVKASDIPMFRYASGRKDASDKMVKMIDSTRSVKRNPFTNKELEHMVQLRKSGLSWFDIHEAMFDKFGTAVHRGTIENAVCRYSSGDPLKSIERKNGV